MKKTATATDPRCGWKGSRLDWEAEVLHRLSPAEIADIDAALHHLKSLGDLDFPEITRDRFPLPVLGPRFAAFEEELCNGRGVLLLRGLPRERYTPDQMARIFFGLGSHFGPSVPQSHHGELLGNVVDVSDFDVADRGYRRGGKQSFHTDSTEIVALMCLRAAKSGGVSRIASSRAIHDALGRDRPDLLKVLTDGLTFRRSELDAQFRPGSLVRERMPVFAVRDGRFTCYYSPFFARNAVARGDAVLTPLEAEAMQAVEDMAASPEFHLDMSIGEGDIQFLNNRLILHSRTHYEDDPAFERRRHMLRLWLVMPHWPQMPAEQGMQNAEDYVAWARQRTPGMEMPSTYIAAMTRRKAAARGVAA